MLFVDSSNKDDVKRWIMDYQICEGVTSNPAILLKDGNKDIEKVIEDLLSVSRNYPVNIELTKTHASDDELVNEAAEYVDNLQERVIIKVPFWTDGRGIRIIKRLQKIGIRTNATCLMNCEQVLLAALAGADYASMFFRRIVDYNKTKDYSSNEAYEIAFHEIQCAADILDSHALDTQLIAGSIREPEDVSVCLLHGCGIVTVTPKILEHMMQHSSTDSTILEFDKAWEQLKNVK